MKRGIKETYEHGEEGRIRTEKKRKLHARREKNDHRKRNEWDGWQK